MAPSKTGKASTKSSKKEKIFHPQSRKADQLSRKALRKDKCSNDLASRAHDVHIYISFDSNHPLLSIFVILPSPFLFYLADFYGFFYHSMPAEGTLTLEELHSLIADVWLKRYDEELETERAARRKGRPKSVKESKLEELILRESEQYRTGFEVIDLTHPENVTLFRTWDQKEVPFIDLLQFIRICSASPNTFVISRPGKHYSITKDPLAQSLPNSGDMELDT
ncbi:hypothetical protein F5879DRAFT_408510 [Lentinula edodes]|nr:hypothetical protein F5879DRAFT_408510 [Lentinula edodes]